MLKKEHIIYATFALQLILVVVLIFVTFGRNIGSSGGLIDSSAPTEMMADASFEQAPSMRSFSKGMGGAGMSAPPAASSSLLVEVAEANEESSQYLVKTGNLRGRVDSLKDVRSKIVKTIKLHKGQIESENQSRYNQSINLNLNIKVPSENFENLLDELSGHTTFLDNKSSQVVDKFKQYTDLESNIKNQTLLRDRYRNILSNAKKVKDLLEIERELANVQRRIDEYKRQLDSLKDLIARSTISAAFYEQLPLSKQKNQLSFLRQFSNSFIQGLSRTKSFFLWMISLWPFILVLAGVIYYFIRKRRR
jgi:hypothetical protein